MRGDSQDACGVAQKDPVESRQWVWRIGAVFVKRHSCRTGSASVPSSASTLWSDGSTLPHAGSGPPSANSVGPDCEPPFSPAACSRELPSACCWPCVLHVASTHMSRPGHTDSATNSKRPTSLPSAHSYLPNAFPRYNRRFCTFPKPLTLLCLVRFPSISTLAAPPTCLGIAVYHFALLLEQNGQQAIGSQSGRRRVFPIELQQSIHVLGHHQKTSPSQPPLEVEEVLVPLQILRDVTPPRNGKDLWTRPLDLAQEKVQGLREQPQPDQHSDVRETWVESRYRVPTRRPSILTMPSAMRSDGCPGRSFALSHFLKLCWVF